VGARLAWRGSRRTSGALVNVVMNLYVAENAGNSLTGWGTIASQGLWYMELVLVVGWLVSPLSVKLKYVSIIPVFNEIGWTLYTHHIYWKCMHSKWYEQYYCYWLLFGNIICLWIIKCNRWASLYYILFRVINQKVSRDIKKSPVYNNYSTFIELSVLLQLYNRIVLLPQIHICPCSNDYHRQQKKSYQKC
jgi:hypothetical protein